MIKLTDGSVLESRVASEDENSSVPDNDTNRKKTLFFRGKKRFLSVNGENSCSDSPPFATFGLIFPLKYSKGLLIFRCDHFAASFLSELQ